MATVDDWLAAHGFAPPTNPLLTPPTPGLAANGPQVSPDTLAALGIDQPLPAEMAGSPAALGGNGGGGAAPGTGVVPGAPPAPGGGAPPVSPDLMAALGAAGGPGGGAPAMDGALQPSVGATQDNTAPTLFGYNPQPRPALPGAIGTPPEDGSNDLFGDFRGAWGGGESEGGSPQDLLSSLTAGQSSLPGMPGETPPSRALTPPWMGGGSGGGSYGPQPQGPGAQMMRDRFPAALQRLNWLRDLRTRRGY